MTIHIEVLNVSDPDQIILFKSDGQEALFGRDDSKCEIVIWSALNDRNLSRVAGRLWRMEGQMWLRNLSLRHELVVSVAGGVLTPPLAPRRGPWDPGEARCLNTGTTVVLGPGGCELIVTQTPAAEHGGADKRADRLDTDATIDLPDIPDRVRDIALALCEPLLLGAPMPATYRQIALRLHISSLKRVRTLVTELCFVYGDAATAAYLSGNLERPERYASDGATRPPQLSRGVWRFLADSPEPTTSAPRSHELVLPEYLAVAQMLVRRGLVRLEHLSDLEALEALDAPGCGLTALDESAMSS